LSTSSLTSGTHTITASVTDSGGKSASSSITVVVNSTPTISITAPADGSTFTLGQDVTFTASASDVEDTSLTVRWTSSVDGDLGAGASLTKNTLSTGSHTVTASVTDSGGKSASTQIAITIQ